MPSNLKNHWRLTAALRTSTTYDTSTYLDTPNNIMTESSDEEEHQHKLLRSLWNDNDADDKEDSDEDSDGISEHVWTSCSCPNPNNKDIISITYHLALLAPGHGNSIWNSSECIAQHLLHPEYRSILFGPRLIEHTAYKWPPSRSIEFGAGAALPSLVLLKEGTNRVIFTDRYVNQQTFDALQLSVDVNAKSWGISEKEVKERVGIIPHTWGEDVEKLTMIPTQQTSGDCQELEKAALLIASDCIYNPAHHKALLQSAISALDTIIGLFVVGYSFHGNVPPTQILEFFEVAKSNEFGLEVVNEFEKKYSGQLGIGGEDENRGTVYVKVLASKGSVYFK